MNTSRHASNPRGSSAPNLSIEELIDAQPLSVRQLAIVALCFAVAALDGLDLAIVGFVAPAIRVEWQLHANDLALLFSAGLLGLTIGAFAAGPIADTLGRKKVLLAAVALFGCMCLACAFARGFPELYALRILTDVGLGAAAPNAITLTSEYCPARRRSFLVTAMFCGFTLGSAAGGGLVVPLIFPHGGWRAVLLFVGVLPLLLLPVLSIVIPESLNYLVLRRAHPGSIATALRRVFPNFDARAHTLVARRTGTAPRSPVSQLFTGRLKASTFLLWTTYFLNLFVVYLISNWLPTIMADSGMPLSIATVVVGAFQMGGTIGALTLGYFMDRRRPETVLSGAYFLGASFIALLGFVIGSKIGLAICIFLAGACVSGSMTGVNALASGLYPTESRATGVSWSMGIGRLGAVLGSMAGAWLFNRGLGLQAAFGLTALPALAISAAIAILGRIHSPTDSPQLQPSTSKLTNPIPAAPPMEQETYSVH
jgi:AAHS family 4-hydroxybenzoate transporter-like MFS transporter